MTTITQNSAFKIQKNSLNNFFVVDTDGYCVFRTDSEKKATNFFKKASYAAGL